MKITLRFIASACLGVMWGCAAAPSNIRQQQTAPPIDLAIAQRNFTEAKWLADDEGGKLWGVSLYGPMLFVDPQTRFVVANEADKEGKLTRNGEVWTGTLPAEVTIANTGTDWAGVRWAMIMWPIQRTFTTERYRLLIHENFHRVQDQIGLKVESGPNAHLDSMEGRTWLRIEGKALEAALKAGDLQRRKEAAADALLFRAYRYSIFPEAAEKERLMELNEGLAEYTGIRSRGTFPQETRYHMGERIGAIDLRRPAFAYAFAYETGPSYGLLLDLAKEGWTKTVTKDSSLPRMLADAWSIPWPTAEKAKVLERAKVYGGDEIIRDEENRAATLAKEIADYRARLVDGPVLTFSLNNAQYSFDPNTVRSLEPIGMVYPHLDIAAPWGKLTVKEGGLLIEKGFMVGRVPAPSNASTLSGPGWTLELSPDWKIVPGKRKGDYEIKKG